MGTYPCRSEHGPATLRSDDYFSILQLYKFTLTDRNAAWEDLYLTSHNGIEAAVLSFSYVHCHTFNS